MPFNFILFWSGRMYADLLIVVPNYITRVSMNLPLSTSHRLNSRFMNFVPFAPVAKGAYAMQLEVLDGAKFKYESSRICVLSGLTTCMRRG
jgi:hypothetical protein